MIGKKGSAHLEVVLSFTIFVGFTFFLLIYLQPTKNTNLADSIMEGFEGKFFDSASVDFTRVLVNASSPCCMPAEVSGNAICKSISESTFFYISISDEFSDSLVECSEEYKIGFINKKRVLADSYLKEVESKYFDDYQEIRSNMGIPSNMDFSVVSDGYILEKNIPENIDVIARSYRKSVLFSNGSILEKEFVIRIW